MVNNQLYGDADKLFPDLFTSEELEKLSILDYRDRFVKKYGQPESFEDCIFIELCYKRELLKDRQERYGPHNILKRKWLGILTRKDDKISRIEVILQDSNNLPEDPKKLKDLSDAFIDDANYSDIALLLMAGLWGKPLNKVLQKITRKAQVQEKPPRKLPTKPPREKVDKAQAELNKLPTEAASCSGKYIPPTEHTIPGTQPEL